MLKNASVEDEDDEEDAVTELEGAYNVISIF
jgi:hypothetical protein